MKGRKAAARSRAVPASEFKATCLSLMDEVARKGSEIIITKHRRPVARLAAVEPRATVPFVNRSPGMIHTTCNQDLIAPINPDWEVDADL